MIKKGILAVFLAFIAGIAIVALASYFSPPEYAMKLFSKIDLLGQIGCRNANGIFHRVPETPLRFCYQSAWGEPSVNLIPSSEGEQFLVKFSEDKNSDLHAVTSFPRIWYYTEGRFCAKCINFRAEESNILAALNLTPKTATVKKTEVAGHPAIKIFLDSKTKHMFYFIPYAFDNFHVQIAARYEQMLTLDEFTKFVQV